jgi:hypothetical protein
MGHPFWARRPLAATRLIRNAAEVSRRTLFLSPLYIDRWRDFRHLQEIAIDIDVDPSEPA